MATCGLIGLVVVILLMSGLAFRVGANQPHSKLFGWAIHRTMLNSVGRHAHDKVLRLPLDQATLVTGAKLYQERCLACHGGPGVPRAPWVSAMLPTPPYLVDASTRWTHAELYVLIRDGVKMTGMPAWGEVSSDREIAETVALLEAMPRMTPAQFAGLRHAARPVSRKP